MSGMPWKTYEDLSAGQQARIDRLVFKLLDIGRRFEDLPIEAGPALIKRLSTLDGPEAARFHNVVKLLSLVGVESAGRDAWSEALKGLRDEADGSHDG